MYFAPTTFLSSVLLYMQSVIRRRHYWTVCEDSIGISACSLVQNATKSQGHHFVSTFLMLWTHFIAMNKHVSSFTHKPKSIWNSTSLLYIATCVASPTTNNRFLLFCETRYEEHFTEDHAKLSLTASAVTNGIMGPLCRLWRKGYYCLHSVPPATGLCNTLWQRTCV
jgi:hypothetical protein